MSENLRKGLRFEKEAGKYLQRQGLELLQSNYRCRFGEIDLIMLDADSICFIEVRFRSSDRFGGAAASITHAKQRKIVKAALCYLAQNRRLANRAPRFDALLIQRLEGSPGVEFDWIKNAFYAE
jgi:putative endonuclease